MNSVVDRAQIGPRWRRYPHAEERFLSSSRFSRHWVTLIVAVLMPTRRRFSPHTASLFSSHCLNLGGDL